MLPSLDNENICLYNGSINQSTSVREEPTMFSILRAYFASRRRIRQLSGTFFRCGMRCDLLPVHRGRKTQRRFLTY